MGIAAVLRSKPDHIDYYLAGRGVSPPLVGLSAIATNNSGFMFIGVIGFTYTVGLAAIWLMIGWIVGDFIASMFIHRKLRQFTEQTNEPTFAGVLSRWNETDFTFYRKLMGFVSLLFLGVYAAAQLGAGSKALGTLFDLDVMVAGAEIDSGAIMVAVIVVAYSVAGGIRASIWTDVAQSFVMVLAMGLLLTVAVMGLGGISGAWEAMGSIPDEPQFLNLFPPDNELLIPGGIGIGLFILGWMFAGFSVVGQPHIMVRFMALKDPKTLVQARVWYYGYFTLFYSMATGVGLLARLYLPELANPGQDPEIALPLMAQELLPPVLVGLILAGVFAATISTADSLVLSCSAAVTHDLLPKRFETSREMKFATFGVTALALVITLTMLESVFFMVITAWSVLASAFAPLLLIYALNLRVSQWQAITMMVVGVSVALGWRFLLEWHSFVYEGFPGIVSGVLTYFVLRLMPNVRAAADGAELRRL
ncbi:MAG: sodium/proline symporter [Alphaproteobacteria bacterium]